MIRTVTLALVLTLAALQPAAAACYADYKAKQQGGALKLHYGVVQVSNGACGDRAKAEAEVRAKVARGGWTLLNVLSVFDESGLDQRRKSAGDFFLRF